jgi:hypothetical protein
MTSNRLQPMRPRAIEVPKGTSVNPRLAWTLMGVTALLLLVSVRAAIGGAPVRAFAVADAVLPYSLEAAQERIEQGAPAPTGGLREVHAITQRVTLRTPDRSRRTAGRAGISARRDLGYVGAVLPANAGAPQVSEGGTAPFGAPAAAHPPARGIVAHGVRGPPSFSFVAG